MGIAMKGLGRPKSLAYSYVNSTNERNAEEGGNTGLCMGGMKAQEEIP